MIYNKFIEYLNYNELIDSKFMKLLIENYIKENHLENYYEKTTIDFLSPYMAAYLKDKKEIVINTDLFVKEALHIKGDYDIFEMKPEVIYQLNFLLLSTIYHELTHVNQMNEKNDLMNDIFNNCFEQMKKNIRSYYAYHKYFITEWNANINAELYIDKFLDNLIYIDSNKENNKVNDRIYVWLNEMYKEVDGKIICPLEYYNYYTNQEYNENVIKNNNDYKKFSIGQQMIYGLPIDNYKKLNKEEIKILTKNMKG